MKTNLTKKLAIFFFQRFENLSNFVNLKKKN